MHECDFCHRAGIQVKKCSALNMYLCSKHWNQYMRHGRLISDEEKIKTCKVCGASSKEKKVCWNTKAQMYLCGKHTDQINRLGHVKEHTKRDKNKYIIHDDYAEILFEDSENHIFASALIDLEDVERCSLYKWTITEMMGNTRYVKAMIDDKHVSLHRFVMRYDGNNVIDHINRNGLDNRKCNLRIVTESENSVNSKTRAKTGEKNIYHKGTRYQVQIIRHYVSVYTETFDTLKEAIIARDSFIVEYNRQNKRKV